MKISSVKQRTSFAVKLAAVIVLAAFVIISQTGCSNKEPVSKTEFCLNTTCDISIYGMDKKESEQILKDAFDKVRDYENLLSRTVKGSDIYNINNAEGRPVEVSDDTAALLKEAKYMGDISKGRFDVTIGKITDMWNFTGEKPQVPSEADLAAAVKAVNYENINIDGNKVSLENPAAAIDLGGIAKGYIADRTAEFLESKGADRAIVNLGGNVVAVGDKEEGVPWNIGVERPYSDHTEVIGAVKAEDETLVTSGIYERKFEQNGVIYHHVLNPKTGYPADTDLESVTIRAEKGNSYFCDGLSTICLMAGKDEAIRLVEKLQKEYPEKHLEAAFIDKDNNVVQTDGMKIQMSEGE